MHDTANAALSRLLARLKNAPVNLMFGDATWEENVERMREPGRLSQIDEGTYRHFLDVLPPRYLGDDFFAFTEGVVAPVLPLPRPALPPSADLGGGQRVL